MGTYAIQIDDKAIEESISVILNKVLNMELVNRYSDSGRVMSEGIKELIYSRKDEIIRKLPEAYGVALAYFGG